MPPNGAVVFEINTVQVVHNYTMEKCLRDCEDECHVYQLSLKPLLVLQAHLQSTQEDGVDIRPYIWKKAP